MRVRMSNASGSISKSVMDDNPKASIDDCENTKTELFMRLDYSRVEIAATMPMW